MPRPIRHPNKTHFLLTNQKGKFQGPQRIVCDGVDRYSRRRLQLSPAAENLHYAGLPKGSHPFSSIFGLGNLLTRPGRSICGVWRQQRGGPSFNAGGHRREKPPVDEGVQPVHQVLHPDRRRVGVRKHRRRVNGRHVFDLCLFSVQALFTQDSLVDVQYFIIKSTYFCICMWCVPWAGIGPYTE